MSTSTLHRGLLLIAGLLTVALSYVIADVFRNHITEAGDTAPNFIITTDNGRTISRKDFGGKVLVLNFWATWCPPCMKELPSLSEFARQTQGSGIVVLAISVDKNERLYRDVLKRNNVSFLTARDPEANVSAEYGTFKFPETYIINSEGKVVSKLISDQDWTDPDLIASIKKAL